MVNLDLRKLSAPLEELRPDVDAAYKRLDEKWDAIRKQLDKLPIPCTVSYAFAQSQHCPDDCVCLEFRKWKGYKRLCITSYWSGSGPDGWEEGEDVTPFEEWSGEQRVQMLLHVPDLFQNAVKQVKAFIDKTKDEENQ